MELTEIYEKIVSAAEDSEVDISTLGEYQLSLNIIGDDETTNGIVSDIGNNIEFDEDERVIYVNIQLY